MAILRNSTQDGYSVITNNIFRDGRLSLKTRGLLCTMLSLPDGWEFSEKGLTAIIPDGISSIRTGLKQLEEAGYLVRIRERGEDGSFSSVAWVISNTQIVENPQLENPIVDNPNLENRIQLSTKELKTNVSTTKKPISAEKKTAESIIDESEFSDEVKRSLREFAEYRKERKQPLTAIAAEKAINVLRSLPDDETRIKSIDQSILNNWRGLFDVKGSFGNGSNDKRGMVQAHYDESYVPF